VFGHREVIESIDGYDLITIDPEAVEIDAQSLRIAGYIYDLVYTVP
jgi:hypothetical protein